MHQKDNDIYYVEVLVWDNKTVVLEFGKDSGKEGEIFILSKEIFEKDAIELKPGLIIPINFNI